MPDAKSWAHLVGSVPLPDAETVFRTVSDAWGSHLRRISDGETGRRGRWIWFQREMLEQHPAMEPDLDEPPYALYQWDGQLLRETRYLRFRSDADPNAVNFPTGYAEAALESFDLYTRLQADGVIPPDALFQVSLPTPMATAYMYVSPSSRDAYLPAYERSLLSAVDRLLASAPHDRSVDPVGCMPGSAAVRGLFPAPARGLQGAGLRGTRASGLCHPRHRRSRLPLVLRLSA